MLHACVMQKNLKETVFENTQGLEQKIDSICASLKLVVGVVARLRGPFGCPWDREQDHLTLRPYLIEEAYETLEILDRYEQHQDPKQIATQTPKDQIIPTSGNFSADNQKYLKEELGDLLLQVVLHAQICWERGDFSIGDVAEQVTKKLIHRHPHVFGDAKVANSDEVLQNWEILKKKEGKKSLLSGLPRHLPSLQRAARIGEKAHRVGFDWRDWNGALEKVTEELHELTQAISLKEKSAIEHEIGDLFFSLCHLARHLNISPEDAHRSAIVRFEHRFEKMEKILQEKGKDIHNSSLEELDQLWEQVKSE